MADVQPPAAGASAAGAAESLVSLTNVMAGAEADAKAMPVRQYLESKVVPLLLQGMQRLVIERPVDPVEFLANFLNENNPNKPKEEPAPPSESAAQV